LSIGVTLKKLIGGVKLNGIWRKRYITGNGLIEIETDQHGTETIKRIILGKQNQS